MPVTGLVFCQGCWGWRLEGTRHKRLLARRAGVPSPGPVLQVLSSLLLSKENVLGWPKVVVEDVVQQARRLKNEMFVMGGKIQGKPLLPLPEHLDSRDGSSTILDRWVPPAPVPLGAVVGGSGSRDAGSFPAQPTATRRLCSRVPAPALGCLC